MRRITVKFCCVPQHT